MNHFHAISTLAALGASVLVAQPKPAPSEGKVLGVIQWFTVVADLPKAEQFYHETMGLESPGGDPRMRLEYYAVVPFLIEMYNNKIRAPDISCSRRGISTVSCPESRKPGRKCSLRAAIR